MRQKRSLKGKLLYTVLQVPANASPEDIRKSFRSLVSYFHPDKMPEKQPMAKRWATKHATRLNEAAEILGDSRLRQKYDAEEFGENADFAKRGTLKSLSHNSTLIEVSAMIEVLAFAYRYDAFVDFLSSNTGLEGNSFHLIRYGILYGHRNLALLMRIYQNSPEHFRNETIHAVELNLHRNIEQIPSSPIPPTERYPFARTYPLFLVALDDHFPNFIRLRAQEALVKAGQWF